MLTYVLAEDAILDEIPTVTQSSIDVRRSAVTLHPDADSDSLNAFTALFTVEAKALATTQLGDLRIAIKDNVAVTDVSLTCGSHIFEQVVPDQNAVVVERLLNAGAELVGKTNMDELATNRLVRQASTAQSATLWTMARWRAAPQLAALPRSVTAQSTLRSAPTPAGAFAFQRRSVGW